MASGFPCWCRVAVESYRGGRGVWDWRVWIFHDATWRKAKKLITETLVRILEAVSFLNQPPIGQYKIRKSQTIVGIHLRSVCFIVLSKWRDNMQPLRTEYNVGCNKKWQWRKHGWVIVMIGCGFISKRPHDHIKEEIRAWFEQQTVDWKPPFFTSPFETSRR